MGFWKVAIKDDNRKLERRARKLWHTKREAYFRENGHYVRAPKLSDIMADIVEDGCTEQTRKMKEAL